MVEKFNAVFDKMLCQRGHFGAMIQHQVVVQVISENEENIRGLALYHANCSCKQHQGHVCPHGGQVKI